MLQTSERRHHRDDERKRERINGEEKQRRHRDEDSDRRRRHRDEVSRQKLTIYYAEEIFYILMYLLSSEHTEQ